MKMTKDYLAADTTLYLFLISALIGYFVKQIKGIIPLANNYWSEIVEKYKLQFFWKALKTAIVNSWPRHNSRLQTKMFICIVIVAFQRFLVVFLAHLYKVIIDSLDSGSSDNATFSYKLIALYVFLRAMHGFTAKGGVLSAFCSYLWIDLEQEMNKSSQTEFYNHIHNLSMRWHLEKQMGAVLNIMNRGVQAINQLICCLTFDILPTIADVLIAIGYFTLLFDVRLAGIVFLTIITYASLLLVVTPLRNKLRSSLNCLDDELNAKTADALGNFETVKCCCAEKYEVSRFGQQLTSFHKVERRYMTISSCLDVCLDLVICFGMMLGYFLSAHLAVSQNGSGAASVSVGTFALFGTYASGVFNHLCWLGVSFRTVMSSLTDIESMQEILDAKQDVVDAPQATSLQVSEGKVEFNHVSFCYVSEFPILKDLSFTIQPGETVAIVGPSGSGKSTIIKLLLRLYDATEGSIFIDGQNVSNVTQKSLRKSIGLVSQDTVLFNETVSYNVKYENFFSSDLDVQKAAEKANMHDRIIALPNGYKTMVGERGLQLSGGEKQRLVIARAILSSPKIMLLDEATSSLDSQSERAIQKTLDDVCVKATTLMVAHRLATVVNADKILVLQAGVVVEQGKHSELLQQKGLYHQMWKQQANL